MDKRKNELFAICSRIGFAPSQFLGPAVLALLSAGAEATAALLLIPTLSLVFDPTSVPPKRMLWVLESIGFVVNKEVGYSSLIPYLGALTALAAFLKLHFSYRSVSKSVALSCQFSTKLQSTLFTLLGRLDNRFFHERKNSDLAYLLQAFPDRVAIQMRPLHRNLSNIFLLCAYCLVLLKISWKLCIICFFLGLGYQFIMNTVLRNLRARAAGADALRSTIGSQVQRLMSCYNLMKLLGETSREADAFNSLAKSYSKESEESATWTELITPLFDAMSIVMIIIVTYASQRIWGGLDVSSLPDFLVFVFILRRASAVSSSIRELQAHYVTMQGSLAEIGAIFEDAGNYLMPSGDLVYNGDFQDIEFQNVSFSYHSNRTVLTNVSFHLRRGSRTAVIGTSGSGKTTLAQFLVRLWNPTEGQILIDGIPLQNFRIESLRQHIGIVCQDTSEVFSGTLRENLLYGLRDISEDQLRELLGELGLLQRFDALPFGLSTSITDKGVTLSGGERQLLSLVRTILRKSSLIILDEVTSALDPETTQKVERLLQSHAAEATIFEVTHRLSRTATADQILLLSEGQLTQFGALESLTEEQRQFVNQRALRTQ